MKRKPKRGPPGHDEHREEHGVLLFRKAPISDPILSSYSLVLSVLQLFNIPTRRGDFAVVLPISRLPENCLGRRTFGPGGTPQEISRGKPAPAGAAPGCHAKRAMPQRGIGEVFGVARAAVFRPPLVASGRSGRSRATSIPDHFFDAPLGHGATLLGFRGRRPLAQTCPRLISSGVPPGRKPVFTH